MCLDIDYHYNNQNSIINTNSLENHNQNIDNNSITMESTTDLKYKVKSMCGGSVIEHKPLFDSSGENIYVVRKDKLRIYSVETGEIVTELDDNKDGQIIGIYLEDNQTNQCIITCTTNGTIAFRKLKSNVITEKKKLNFKFSILNKFLVTTIDGKFHGLIHYNDEKNFSQLTLIELSTNKIVHRFDTPFLTNQADVKMKFADGNGIIAIISKTHLFIINKETLEIIMHSAPKLLSVVVCHPEQKIIATGDVYGKIYLWSNVFNKMPVKTDLHWHHMVVLSLAFSQSGTVLYSGGAECVLVKWHIRETTLGKNFLPRVSGGIKQISVDTLHDKIAICMDDNSIQIINSNLTQLKTIQDFTQISPYDLGLNQPFPAGICINPKNNHLVMNGKIGHLQFFSTKTMRLLFNIDITLQNVIPRQREFNQFSTEVTKVAFSACGMWMATYECWNDRIHSLDSRIKFWSFDNIKQTYSLHTQIEYPHEKKVVAMQFANIEKSIICASAGLDRVVKIWSLEASEEIQNPKMIWMLIEQINYKNLPVKCLSFSQDSSLLSAGFGNSLCVWDTTNFKLKCALSAPAIMDGSVNRVLITLPEENSKKNLNGNKTNFIEKRHKILQMMNAIINDPSQVLVNNLTQERSRIFKRKFDEGVKSQELKCNEKKLIFDKVIATTDLNFNEKLQILHKLNIYYHISNRVENDFIDFISKNTYDDIHLYKGLQQGVLEIKNDDKYKILWRFKTWRMRDVKRNRKIITVRKLLKKPIREEALKLKKAEPGQKALPIKNISNITSTFFCTNDLSHLSVVTTSTRLLIWDLLTLKIQSSFKIQCLKLAHDPLTNLIAIFTKHNELFIIHPLPAITIFHQKNLPNILALIWVPREIPKMQSLSVNWQATSQLLFLNENQEICTLSSPTDEDETIDLTPYMNETNEVTASTTPFAALISKRQNYKDSNQITVRHMLSNDSGSIKEVSKY
ncbi:hypothetical protein PVAND_005196 [Polypedilum vanderplanki]|uniref:WD repeat-containing protein 75 second beta-propeller domain-containing protein n=1 Tax=Polypedilum vanderplanki TaxID=319348 RepID=A0A9J6BZV4_POLVA|nr:hypothetical protein PVAND_005196 [Polypedilum vanderplanki]